MVQHVGITLELKFILTGLGNWSRGWPIIRKGVEEAENQGFWAVLFPDQVMWDPSDLGADSVQGIDSTIDTWVLLPYLASLTSNIRLGTWVTPIPLRHPGLLAKTVSSLDFLSEGRVVLGVGAGATQRMFEAYGSWDPAKTRVDKTREGLRMMLRLWSDERVDFAGKHYVSKGAVLEPKPVQRPHPPLLFGGAGARMLRLAGRYADICYIPPWNKMEHEQARRIVQDEAKRFGRRDKVKFAYAYTPLGPNQKYNREEYRKNVEEAADSGFDYFITAFDADAAFWELDPPSIPRVSELYLKSLLDFAKAFIPSHDG